MHYAVDESGSARRSLQAACGAKRAPCCLTCNPLIDLVFFDPSRCLPVDVSFAFHYVSIAAGTVAQPISIEPSEHGQGKNGIQIP